MLGTDPWHHYRTLRRAKILGVCVFVLTTALVATFAQTHMRSPVLLIPFFGWMIFGLVMEVLAHQVRCPRCGQKFYVKGSLYWQMATKCLHCGQKKYTDVGTPTKPN